MTLIITPLLLLLLLITIITFTLFVRDEQPAHANHASSICDDDLVNPSLDSIFNSLTNSHLEQRSPYANHGSNTMQCPISLTHVHVYVLCIRR